MADSINPYKSKQLFILKLKLLHDFHLFFLSISASRHQSNNALSIETFVCKLLGCVDLFDCVVNYSFLVNS